MTRNLAQFFEVASSVNWYFVTAIALVAPGAGFILWALVHRSKPRSRAWLAVYYVVALWWGSLPNGTFSGSTSGVVIAPLWSVTLLCAILPAVVFARALRRWWNRRKAPGLCTGCGYDIRATPARCPECGLDRKTQ